MGRVPVAILPLRLSPLIPPIAPWRGAAG
jgi:hypothetical protein